MGTSISVAIDLDFGDRRPPVEYPGLEGFERITQILIDVRYSVTEVIITIAIPRDANVGVIVVLETRSLDKTTLLLPQVKL